MNTFASSKQNFSFAHVLTAILLLITVFSVSSSIADELVAADMIVINGKVTTQNPAQPLTDSIAVRDGVIAAVGSRSEVMQYKGKSTVILDANGKRVIPGLNDSHLHATRGGRFYNLEVRWEGVNSLKTGLEMIRQQAQRTPKGQWVRVIGGWSPYQFEEKRFPTIAELNEAAPDTPVFVLFLYSRGFLNKAAIEQLGITKDTVPPPGSHYEKDENGNPSGVLIADPSPVILYQTIGKLPQLTDAQHINSTKHFYRELNRLGLTSVIDAGGGGHNYPDNYSGSFAVAQTGEMPIRVSYYLFPQKPGHELEDFKKWQTMTVPGANKHQSLEHGLEMEGGGEFLVWSAGDYENFMSARPSQSKAMELELSNAVRLLVKNRWPFRIHATYGESVSRILDVLEKVNADTPFDGLRWAIDHAETIVRKDIFRIKNLGGGVAVQSRMAFAG